MSDEIKKIVTQEFEVQGNPSLRKFADWMMENMSKEGETLSHASVINWLGGKPPKTEFLEDMLAVYPINDRRFIFALRLLAVKSPHVWGFSDGVVWKLRESLQKSKYR
jgi:hypothetical protein